jgi:hypothetical protein
MGFNILVGMVACFALFMVVMGHIDAKEERKHKHTN